MAASNLHHSPRFTMSRRHNTNNSAQDLTASADYVHPAIAPLNAVKSHFTQSTEHPNIIQLNRSCTHGNFSIFCIHDTDFDHLELHVVYPIRALPATQFETLRLLNHINSSLPGGVFFLDFSDGEISFRHCVHLGDTPLNSAAFHQALSLVGHTIDRALPLIADVALGHRTFAEALAHHNKESGVN